MIPDCSDDWISRFARSVAGRCITDGVAQATTAVPTQTPKSHTSLLNVDAAELTSTLRRDGVCQIELTSKLEDLNFIGFEAVRCALQPNNSDVLHQRSIPEGADSSDSSGYHAAGGLSRYNRFREGFVFSNGNIPAVGPTSFTACMEQWYHSYLELANQVLLSIAKSVCIQDPQVWVDSLQISGHSQWHVKRYSTPVVFDTNTLTTHTDTSPVITDDDRLLLPLHTDPSVISLVIHDSGVGIQHGAQGLQFQSRITPEAAQYKYTDLAHSGHRVATVFVGSLLEKLSGGLLRAAKHRVFVAGVPDFEVNERMVATFFFRPAPKFVLKLLPSPLIPSTTRIKQMTYRDWKRRTASRYEKSNLKMKQPNSKQQQ
eukprot:m.176493 g.176493  ORF g.176493 m.176493 type:complete len:372 (+) comp31848_c0_seq4:214-1329(+)